MASGIRYTTDQMKEIFKQMGLKFLSKKYINAHSKYDAKCLKCSNIWKIKAWDVISGHSCPKCAISRRADKKRLPLKSVKETYKSYQLEFISDSYQNDNTKYQTKCLKCNHLWMTTCHDVKSGYGCPKCANCPISKSEIKWLDSIGIPEDYRQKLIRINDKRYHVDAFIPETNTIYEFFGDFWHGNPKKYKAENINPRTKCSFGQLHAKTLERIKLFEERGYKVIYIWESD